MASRGKKKQTEARDMKNTQMNRQTDGISGTTGAGGVNGKSRTDRKIKILKTARRQRRAVRHIISRQVWRMRQLCA